jgi:hypothetical protein
MKKITCFADLLESLTLEQAIAWNDDAEQWMHVDDKILSPHNFRASDWAVNQVEDRFTSLLNKAGIELK